MSDNSPNLALPYLMPSQAQKHVTHNEALLRLDALVQLRVAAFGATQPPALPVNGEMYALGTGASDTWAGQDGQLALYAGNAWTFIPPQEGWRAWGVAEAELRVWSGGTWLPVAPMQNIDGLGIGTASDAVNRLAVAADATLLSHGGSDHRLKVNKATGLDTASLLFQSNWSGRAEMGLTGDEDFHVKVSADGSSFTEALQIRRGDGLVMAPCLMSGKISIANDSVGYIATPGAGGIVAVSLVDTDYPQTTQSGILSYDTGPSLSLYALAIGTSLEDHGASNLSGTTGTDGRSSIAVRSGELQIENRHGGTREYAYTFLNTF